VLLALLYTDDGFLAAAAPACDQQPTGNRFWAHLEPDVLREGQSIETAYVDIDDEALVQRLLTMDFPNGHAAARAVDEHLFSQARPLSRKLAS
jgi:hypothetical protein